jgi:FkbM family methyltransferase
MIGFIIILNGTLKHLTMVNKFKIGLYSQQKKDFLNYFQTNNLTYALFPKDNAVSSSIIEGWQYEFYLFEFLKKNQIETLGKEIVDIGGNNGSFAIDFAHLVGDDGKVFTFEAQRIIFQQLCCNLFLNGLSNVYAKNIAIGNKNEIVKIEVPNYFDEGDVNFGAAEIKLDNQGEDIECKRLDDFTFNDVKIIKIDVQGYEKNVILGAQETIKKHRPYIFIEFENHLLEKFGTNEDELREQIESLGYIMKPFQDGIPYSTHSGKCLDWVGIPKEKWEEFVHIIP